MLGAILIGLVAGWLTGKILNGHGYGAMMDILLGLVGSVIGAAMFHAVGIHAYTAVGYLATSTVGAASLVMATRVLRREL